METFRPPDVVADDTRLAEALQADDERAVRTLVDRYGGLVFTVALRIVGDRQHAEDVTQLTFLRAWSARHRFRPGRDFAPWLATIARNAAIDMRRTESRRPTEPLDGEAEPSGGGAVDDVVEQAWSVRAAIESLDPAEREVVRLQHLDGWTHSEIGEHLGIAVGTVKSRSYRAHRRLAGRLRHLRDESSGRGVARVPDLGREEDDDGRA